jgi:site-specific DNA recombinase
MLELVAGAGSNLHLLPAQVKMVAGTGIDHNLQSTPVKMVAGGCTHLYLRSGDGGHLPNGALPDTEESTAQISDFLSILFRTAA